jgi:hypothetical protein
MMTKKTNEYALLVFLGDWIRDSALRDWVFDTNTPWQAVVKVLKETYGMEDCDIGILSKAEGDPKRPLLVGRVKKLLRTVNLHQPPTWGGQPPAPFVVPTASVMSTGWPGGPIVCLESALVGNQPAKLKANVPETVDFLGWNLSGHVVLTFFMKGGVSVNQAVILIPDSCGRSSGSAQVTLPAAGRWSVIVGTDPKGSLPEAVEVI